MSDPKSDFTSNGVERIVNLKGMYQDYFLDYASYVILERAVPEIQDGLKPVQRRILYSLFEKEDGRFHKVANIIGHSMQYHPHGDAAIGDALVNLGQKELLIETQGNWGDMRTGDGAAAPRYIEARLSKFALEVAFNPQTTHWQLSYDGRNKEPVALPMKFPLLLAQGAEGIAVGLSTKILPHNFIELIKASIKILKGKPATVFPDFPTGGLIDITDYNDGKRGGKVKVRARIEQIDKKNLVIKELPYGVTTTSLIESVLKANDKGKIKIKKITDNTAKDVEILIELQPGTSPDVAIDALYALTYCEVSISPNACVIVNEKPHFLSVSDLLNENTEQTKRLFKWELEIKKNELEEKLHFLSLEKIFIENRIYHDIETCETWEAVLETIEKGLRKYVIVPGEIPAKNDKRIALYRDINLDDIVKLTEIRIKRISKFNSFKADELMAKLNEELNQVNHDLAHLVEFAIAYFENLLKKYGKGKERKTEITTFDAIRVTEVVANNAKLYVNRQEGFIGTGLKKDEFVCDCSDIDEIIVFRRDGKMQVSKIADKIFVGKDIIHVDVWKKGDDRTTYNMVYLDAPSGKSMVKRFQVTAITRDREYDLVTGGNKSGVLYFSANPNGEAEVITIQLTSGCRAKIKVFDFDFKELAIKGRNSQGNLLTKYPVKKISLKETGKSTIGAQKVFFDEISGRLNTEGRGKYMGEFDTGDTFFALFKTGEYEVVTLDLTRKFDPNELISIEKFHDDLVVSAVYFEGVKGWTMVKRFKIETSSNDLRFSFLTEHNDSKLVYATTKSSTRLEYSVKFKSKKIRGEINLEEFVGVKGWKAIGNKLSDQKLSNITELEPTTLKTGETIDLNIESNGQTKLF